MRFRVSAEAGLAVAGAVVLGFMLAPRSIAQEAQSASPRAKLAFDAASVRLDDPWPGPPQRPATPHESGGPGTSDPGRITWSHQFLFVIIMRAYDLRFGDQIVGPAWLNERPLNTYTVTATMPSGTTQEQFRIMLQNMLADRFNLVLHHDTRNFGGYDLTIAKDGPKFKEWIPNPDLPRAVAKPGGLQPGQAGIEVSPQGRSPLYRFTGRGPMAELVRMLPGFMTMSNRMLEDAGSGLGSVTRIPRIADKTEQTGTYEFNLEFEGTLIPGNAPSAGGPTLFEALEKQLGLRLVKTKDVPDDVLVIDRLDKAPMAN